MPSDMRIAPKPAWMLGLGIFLSEDVFRPIPPLYNVNNVCV